MQQKTNKNNIFQQQSHKFKANGNRLKEIVLYYNYSYINVYPGNLYKHRVLTTVGKNVQFIFILSYNINVYFYQTHPNLCWYCRLMLRNK